MSRLASLNSRSKRTFEVLHWLGVWLGSEAEVVRGLLSVER